MNKQFKNTSVQAGLPEFAIFRRYMTVIGRDDLGARPDLHTNAGRWSARDELDDAIGEWTAGRTRAAVLAALGDAGIPAGPINGRKARLLLALALQSGASSDEIRALFARMGG